MEKLRTLIVEDEQNAVEALKNLLSIYKDLIEIIGEFNTIETAHKAIINLNPQLVFLDVELQNDTCFTLLNRLHTINFDIIFTTAHEGYALKAFKLTAVDYLLKPIDTIELAKAIEKLQIQRSEKLRAAQYKVLLENAIGKGQDFKFPIPSNSEITYIKISEVTRIIADNAYCTVFLANGSKITTSKKIGEYEKKLQDLRFFRVHRSHMINLNHVVKYHRGKGGVVEMTDGAQLEVSERRKTGFLKALGEFL